MNTFNPSDLLFIDADISVNWRPFTQAREFARSLGFKKWSEWISFVKSGKKPYDIPSYPNETYLKEWINTSDWLGSVRIKGNFRSYKKAKAFSTSLGLNSQNEWQDFVKSGKKPLDIPARPSFVYRNSGWESWADWLGTENRMFVDWLPFEEARSFSRKLGLTSVSKWNKWRKTSARPKNIPSDPSQTYKEWISWADWLGNKNTAYKRQKSKSFTDIDDKRKKVWLPFKEARDFAQKCGFDTIRKWRMFSKSKDFPENIPICPSRVYSEWISWGDWFGTGRVHKIEWKPFPDARTLVRKNNIKSSGAYRKWKNRPIDVPSDPKFTYKNDWISWKDWLGR